MLKALYRRDSRGSLEATVFVSTSHLFGARMVYDFSGPESGTRMEQRFGARIRARIEQLFEARALGCACFSRGSLEATVFVSTSHLFGARMVYDFSGPESGTTIAEKPALIKWPGATRFRDGRKTAGPQKLRRGPRPRGQGPDLERA